MYAAVSARICVPRTIQNPCLHFRENRQSSRDWRWAAIDIERLDEAEGFAKLDVRRRTEFNYKIHGKYRTNSEIFKK